MILRARTIVPVDGEPIDNGAVAIAGNKIAAVGSFDSVRKIQSGEVFDLGEQIMLPGLINAHCHLDYTLLRGKIPPQNSFSNWIRAINAEKANLTGHDYIASIRAGFAEAVRFGTTTIANLTAFPNLIASIKAPIRTWWFGEFIDVRNPAEADRIVEETVGWLKTTEHWGLAPHAPFTASPRLYAQCEETAQKENVPLTTHLAESREEMEMFRDASGRVFDFLKGLGRATDDCGQETPFGLFSRTRRLNQRWIIAHLNELEAGDFELLRRSPKFHVAHCPRSHCYFGHSKFALEPLRELGLNICLGTDSLASNSDLSLFAEMRELLDKSRGVSPREALEMATVNGAKALGQGEQLGCIRAGAFADLIALPISAGDAFESIVSFEGTVSWMILNGKVVARTEASA